MDKAEMKEIYTCLDQVRNIRGQVIECGCARCGTTVLMAEHLRKQHASRTIFACDSFSGFDTGELLEERRRGLTLAKHSYFTQNSYDYVRRKLRRLGYDDIVVPVRGYFQNTLDRLVNQSFCFALIDCDLGQSISYCANKIFPSLSDGGIMLFDDYVSEDYKAVREAVDRFVAKNEGLIREHHPMGHLYYVKKERKFGPSSATYQESAVEEHRKSDHLPGLRIIDGPL